MTQENTKLCLVCGAEFRYRVSNAMYCSKECKVVAQRERYLQYAPPPREIKLTTGTVGAVSELLVCTDLLLAGYEVFRAVSASCGCDMVACKGGRALRVEVRSATVNQSGEVNAPVMARDRGRADVYALVLRDNTISYYPELIPERLGRSAALSKSFVRKADDALAA